jgi:L-lactate utilization protein LutB
MGQTEELVTWSYEQKCEKVVEALGKNGFTAVYCPTSAEARNYILAEAAEARTIGFGGSLSIGDMQVIEPLREAGKELLIHGVHGLSLEERLAIMRRQLTCDLFLTGSNAVTVSGFLVNIDATGNRVAAMFFGPQKVIVVAGRNKLVEGDAMDAMQRVKSWATPPNAKRLNFNTPCARTGFCSNCTSPERLCRVTTILERKPRFTDIRVLVVNEDLGL